VQCVLFPRRGAQAGGFNVLRMISEPVAAVLAYDIGQKDTDEAWYENST